ncbi:hypothetical protein BpHYR1_001472 [Brachionus plicatilis]|uniref:Uncharacterized protein n=1 Tax=Brachionus plicatilis TaxID=10195 RepID=A0A3M7PSR1_BRAPC|nr:hypothetical protein BpHYR1_001472 [Brachionus plicatilis]
MLIFDFIKTFTQLLNLFNRAVKLCQKILIRGNKRETLIENSLDFIVNNNLLFGIKEGNVRLIEKSFTNK